MNNLQIAGINGDITVTSQRLGTASNGYYLYLTTANNTTSSVQSSIITVSGTGNDGATYTASATLYKNGTGGSITISPSTATVLKESGSLTFNVTCTGMNLSTLNTNT